MRAFLPFRRLVSTLVAVLGANRHTKRAAEALNCRWDSQAYGSVLWTLMGLHTVRLLTDAFDTAVLMFTGPLEERCFVDVGEDALCWNFVVLRRR